MPVKVKFIGVGEAFDEHLPNTSILVQTEDGPNRSSILLDCGFTVPPSVWKNCPDANALDAVWISHFHGDHFFGMPALLARFYVMKRIKPLLVAGQEGIESVIHRALELAYPSVAGKLTYEIRYLTVEPGDEVQGAGVAWRSAVSGHPQRNLAVRIESRGKSLFYSGDGKWTEETLSLASGADLVIHEAFRLYLNSPGHSSIVDCMDFARSAKARKLALVHIEGVERRIKRDEILDIIKKYEDSEILVPEPGDELEI
jgi:ribonuclease Z